MASGEDQKGSAPAVRAPRSCRPTRGPGDADRIRGPSVAHAAAATLTLVSRRLKRFSSNSDVYASGPRLWGA